MLTNGNVLVCNSKNIIGKMIMKMKNAEKQSKYGLKTLDYADR